LSVSLCTSSEAGLGQSIPRDRTRLPTVHGRRHTATPWLWHYCTARVVVVLGDSYSMVDGTRDLSSCHPVIHFSFCPAQTPTPTPPPCQIKIFWRTRREENSGPSWTETESPPTFGICRETTITQHILPSPLLQKQSKQPIKPQKQTSVVKTTYQIPPGPTLVPRIVKSRGPQRHPAPDRVQNLPIKLGHVNPLKDFPFNLPV
jgi:hypothetical protein